MNAIKDVWSVIKVFYWILKPFGLAPFSIDGKIENGKIKTSRFDFCHFSLVLSVQVWVLYINFYENYSLSRTNSFLIDKGAYCIEIFNAFNVIFGSCLYAVNRRKFWAIFISFHSFDQEVRSFGWLNLQLFYKKLSFTLTYLDD